MLTNMIKMLEWSVDSANFEKALEITLTLLEKISEQVISSREDKPSLESGFLFKERITIESSSDFLYKSSLVLWVVMEIMLKIRQRSQLDESLLEEIFKIDRDISLLVANLIVAFSGGDPLTESVLDPESNSN